MVAEGEFVLRWVKHEIGPTTKDGAQFSRRFQQNEFGSPLQSLQNVYQPHGSLAVVRATQRSAWRQRMAGVTVDVGRFLQAWAREHLSRQRRAIPIRVVAKAEDVNLADDVTNIFAGSKTFHQRFGGLNYNTRPGYIWS